MLTHEWSVGTHDHGTERITSQGNGTVLRLIIKQLQIKHIRSIAFASVVGGKHQTTAGELGTPTKAKKLFKGLNIPAETLLSY